MMFVSAPASDQRGSHAAEARVVQDRERDVARDVGRQQLEQLVLRAEGVPQREVAHRRVAARDVDRAVGARVGAVDVADHVRDAGRRGRAPS